MFGYKKEPVQANDEDAGKSSTSNEDLKRTNPTSMDWRSEGAVNYVSPVKNQG